METSSHPSDVILEGMKGKDERCEFQDGKFAFPDYTAKISIPGLLSLLS